MGTINNITPEQLEELLDKYVNNELNPEKELEAFFLNQVALGNFQEEIALHKTAIQAIKDYHEWQELKKKLSSIELPTLEETDTSAASLKACKADKIRLLSFQKYKRWTWWSVAAATLISGGLFLYLWRNSFNKQETLVIAQSPSSHQKFYKGKDNSNLQFSLPNQQGNANSAPSTSPMAPTAQSSENSTANAIASVPRAVMETKEITFTIVPSEENLGFSFSQPLNYKVRYSLSKNKETFVYRLESPNMLIVEGPAANFTEIIPFEVRSTAFDGSLNGYYFFWRGEFYFLEGLDIESSWKIAQPIKNELYKNKLRSWLQAAKK
ncbi:MAG: hypothetical protein RML72_05085 [Bacteroidia bacterium]|nr:hypothetical protein [Bacteroidia bacterium]MDW8158238.1 hypothetical protein [Bacteroidia bacterium]